MKTLLTVLCTAILFSSGCSLFKPKGPGPNAGGGDGVPRNQNARVDNLNKRNDRNDTHDDRNPNNLVDNGLNNPFFNPNGLTDFTGFNGNKGGDTEGLNKRVGEPKSGAGTGQQRETDPGSRNPASESEVSAPRVGATLTSPFTR